MATPATANAFVQQQLDSHAAEIESAFDADMVGFGGPLLVGVDDLFRNVVESLKDDKKSGKDKLVVILTTTGGYIEVVQRIVDTLRHHYRIVDFVIPNYAYSAGTVLAMSGDAIYMNYYSRLGPIDPQVETKNRNVSALGYLIKWEKLIEKAKKGELTTVEAQLMIDGFDQAELYHYEQARELSIALLKEWLAKYKFKNWDKTETRKLDVTDQMREERAAAIAATLNDTERWHSHGYGISMEVLRNDLNVQIDDFDGDLGVGQKVKAYYALFDDYMKTIAREGVLHTTVEYLPFM